nr:radical SAM protein [uncultured Holophaga sp.]
MASLFDTEPQAPLLFGECLVEPGEARSILRPQRDERLGFGFALSPYRGCSHGCRYCYVRGYPDPFHPREDWGRWIAPKTNAPELLWAQRHRLRGASIFLSTATDPYQPLEREFRLTRACLKILLELGSPKVVLHTRSALVLQDLELLRDFGPRLSVGLSIPTDDDTVRQVAEPRAPAIPTRWSTMERLARGGIRVGVAVSPLLPVDNPAIFARRAAACGASSAWVGRLRLLDRDPFRALLEERGWEHILSPDYAEQVREAFHRELPQQQRPLPPPDRPGRAFPRPRPEAQHPPLF